MIIVVDVAEFYDWLPTEDKPSEADVMALKYKPAETGKWLKKTTVQQKTHTSVSIPDQEVADCMAYFARKGIPRNRPRVVAWYLEEIVMPHHAHPEKFLSVSVHDDPEVEAYLNKYFNTTPPAPKEQK